jgi:DNA-binding NtrC family response regulator
MVEKCIPHILIVDSEDTWVREVRAALEQHGRYIVTTATDMKTAWQRSSSDGFDLILVNASLALGEHAARFREIVRLYPEKVLVIADFRSISAAIRVFKMGADYMGRPLEAHRVVELVSRRLGFSFESID